MRGRGVITISGAHVAPGARIVVGDGDGSERLRVASVEGASVTVTRWRWWHSVAWWLRRAARAAWERAREAAQAAADVARKARAR